MSAAQLRPVKIRKPRKGTKAEAILTLAATTTATPTEIADTVNTSRQMVHQTLERYGIEYNRTQSFKEHRADILAGLQDKILNSIDIEEIKKAPMGSKVLAACQLYDKERLERDLSTSNVASVHADIAAIKALQDLDKPE